MRELLEIFGILFLIELFLIITIIAVCQIRIKNEHIK